MGLQIDIWLWVVTGGLLFFASLLQSVVGFGFSLFLVPVLLSMGYSLQDTVMLSIVNSSLQRTMAIVKLRKAIDWRTLLSMLPPGLVGLGLGIALLYAAATHPSPIIKQIVGGVILLMLLIRYFYNVQPRDAIHKAWSMLAGFMSGLLSGFANIGGPPIVLWILAHRWSSEKIRVTTIAYGTLFVPVQLTILLILFGSPIVTTACLALTFAPLTLFGGWVGLHLGGKIKTVHLRSIATILLLIIAISSILKPFFE